MNKHLQIVNYLGKHPRKRFTMHELSKLCSIPYASFYRAIQDMEDVLEIDQIGKSKIVSLSMKNPIVKAHLTISSDEEKKEFLPKHPIIKKITKELKTHETVILFGSYAKSKETEKSDIDVLIINKDGQKTISFSKYEILFKKKINPIFVTAREFKIMLRDNDENVGKQALKNHIILNNPERFWELVLNAI